MGVLPPWLTVQPAISTAWAWCMIMPDMKIHVRLGDRQMDSG
jgi:hypothetical protein